MNYLQRAWLYALRPITPLINEKIAKRSGFLGRIGKFFAIGPRQFGYHPIHKFIAWVNESVVETIGMTLHRHAYLKGVTGRGFHSLRTGGLLMLAGPLMIFFGFFWLALPLDFEVEEGTSYQYLKDRVSLAPINGLNERISAHFTEINGHYSSLMLQKYHDLIRKTVSQREQLNEKTKKTRYARPGYKYIKAFSKPDGL